MVYTPEPTIMAEDRDDYVSEEELIARMQESGDFALSEEDSDFEVNMDNVIITEYRAKEQEGVGNIVQFVQWHYEWTHPDYPGAVAVSGFTTELPDPDSENFIHFDLVSVPVLKQWVVEKEMESLKSSRQYAMEQIPFEYKLSQTTAYTIV